MKLTRRNPNHPWNIYKDERQKAKAEIRQLSTDKMRRSYLAAGLAFDEGAPINRLPTRREMQEALLRFWDREWNREWENQYGFPFEEVRDFDKLKARIDAGNFAPKEFREKMEGGEG